MFMTGDFFGFVSGYDEARYAWDQARCMGWGLIPIC